MSDRDAILARDRAARLAAQTEFDRPLVVEAGAGTGKTAVLVARVVAWAMGPGWDAARSAAGRPAPWEPRTVRPESVAARVLDGVVAITFTEAAAAEMEERVAGALAAVEHDEPPPWVERAVLPSDADERRLRARALLAALDRLHVSTIHAFCRRLLARHPLEAGLDPAFTVDADLTAVPQVADEVVERALPSLYGGDGDADALELAAEGHGPGALAEAVATLAAAAVPPAALTSDPFDAAGRAAVADGLRDALGAFLAGTGAALAATSKKSGKTLDTLDRLRDLAARLPAGCPSLEALDGLCADLAAMREAKDLERVREWSTKGCNASETAAVGEDAVPTVIAEAKRLWSALDAASRLRPVLLGHARAVLAPLLAETTDELRRRGIVPFQGLLVAARDLLGRRQDVRRRERERITQLLVDEFQDTDPVQCDVLRLLTRDGEDGPCLFIVGDPKQSIYGWRSADLAAYENFVGELLGGSPPHLLAQSFRSVPPILDEVERIVEPVMVAAPGVQPPFQPLVACPDRAAAELFAAAGRGPVEHWICWDPELGQDTPGWRVQEIEAAAIADDLRTLHDAGALAWRDAAILLRTSTALPDVLDALKARGVPFAVERDRSYYRRREIIEAAALVRCVIDPGDQLALVTVLRSAAVGVPDAALVPLWRQHLPEAMLRLRGDDPAEAERLGELVRSAADAVPAGIPGLERVAGWEEVLPGVLAALGRLRRSFAEEPADVFVERLRCESLAEPTEAARYLGAFRLANLDRFFRLLADGLEDTGDPAAVLRLLRTAVAEAQEAEEARPGESVSDAVAVMTVHRAKGLDFRHVYLAQVHRSARPDRDPLIAAEQAGGGTEMILLGAPTPGWQQVRERRATTAAAEMVRALYVASTRARDRLVVSGGLGLKGQRPSFAALLAERRDTPDLAALATEAIIEAGGVRWVFPALLPAADGAGRAAPPWPVAPRQADDDARRLADARGRAAEHQRRPFRQAASAEAHRILEEDQARGSGGSGDGGGAEAAAVGTAIHRFFELFDPAADRRDEIERGRRRVTAELASVAALAPDIASRAAALLEKILAGPLWERFLALAPHLVARELPVALPPTSADGAVGFVAGVVDLVYRDPETGALVVADFKTDAVDGVELDRRAEVYAHQGRVYTTALRQALDLDAEPRFELWFLAAGRIVVPG